VLALGWSRRARRSTTGDHGMNPDHHSFWASTGLNLDEKQTEIKKNRSWELGWNVLPRGAAMRVIYCFALPRRTREWRPDSNPAQQSQEHVALLDAPKSVPNRTICLVGALINGAR